MDNLAIAFKEDYIGADFSDDLLQFVMTDPKLCSKTIEETILADLKEDVINVNVEAVVVQHDGQSYYFDREVFVLSSKDIANKLINLHHTPTHEGGIRLLVKEAPPQMLGYDFALSGSSITWNGLGLDGMLETGEIIAIAYMYK